MKDGDCTQVIVNELNKAKKTILVQAYSFTSKPIANAMVEAQQRGIKVEVILDKSQIHGKKSSAKFLSKSDVPTYVDSKHAIAHNKVIVIDDSVVITGSFNFTEAAQEKNAENILILNSPAIANLYTHNWKIHKEHSDRYSPGKRKCKIAKERPNV